MKLDGGEKRAARLAFAGGASTPPLTKGVLRPLWKPQRADRFIPPASGWGILWVFVKRGIVAARED